ncbi:MAG: FtsK/SpoIIIE domain-containing protein [Thermoguttaceae bacterium]
MTQPFSPDGARRLLAELCRLAAERESVEAEIQASFAARNEAAEREYQNSIQTTGEQYRTQKATAESEYASSRTNTETKYRTEHDAIQQEYENVRNEIVARTAADTQATEQALQDSHWEALEAADAARGGLNLPLKELLAGLDDRWRQLDEIHQQATLLMQRRGHWRDLPPAPPTTVILERHPGRRFCHALDTAQGQWRTLSSQRLPNVFRGLRPFWIFLVLWTVAAIPWAVVLGPLDDWRWAPLGFGCAALVGLIAGQWTHRIAKRRSTAAYVALRQTLVEAGLGTQATLETARADCQRLDATIIARHKAQSQNADKEHAAALARIERRHDHDLQQAEAAYPKRLADLDAWRDATLRQIEEKYPPLLRQLDERFAADSQRIETHHRHVVDESRQRFERAWADMAERWRTGIEQFSQAADQSDEVCRHVFPNWASPAWEVWKPPTDTPTAIPFGYGQVRLESIRGGSPDDERLRPAKTAFSLPIALPFPRHSLLLLDAAGPARVKAVELMQSTMLRLLSAMPPAKVRFTIIDPVGLGENFSAFMHLADFDEQLVASRIWTDSAHIEQRLADLTKHMENIIQVYLRKEFRSIEEYNAFAGEMAEPYRVLVVANFPANFTEAAVQRLKSIVASGARCGVFVLLSHDATATVPRNLQLPDLAAEGIALRWSEGHFTWEHPDYGPLPIMFDPPPPVERFKEIVCTVGAAARDVGRVEVPFSYIIPSEDDWWSGDSRAGIDVPLGRAGAMKLQHLELGAGTSQHVLISGKTGSGKSTLLHVLITNLALRYSPDEIELYLVDFKKGVEFKAYARAGLPHARVVAIESEREFGLSVLERLDAELRTRGDLFRRHGLQDLKGYRNADLGNAGPQAAAPERMPRILLIIDEFQELFVEDDRIAQESALLLDRLVRQGRAFGIHILLGSQTLGGAYTLARSTIGQMAVRIALQCSEADAHLILSEDNTAARLLNRPGEAIYNDANGLYEGNHPFQIVWLSDHDRDDYLEQIAQLAAQHHPTVPPTIVFEGNVLADLADNVGLNELLDRRDEPATDATESSHGARAWLGSAVAIKDPTSAAFMRQNGSNLLIVGHREEAALGIMSAAMISLAAEFPLEKRPGTQTADSGTPRGEGTAARFYVLDGARADAPETGFWRRLTDVLPNRVECAGIRESNALMAQLAAELSARQQAAHEQHPPIFLFVYNLGRFRDLRKEDEYAFSSGDEQPTTPPKQFATILRDGPSLGIHTIVWSDTYTNVTRILDRRSLQDFEMRVLFQMNGNDSSALMDTPEATKLGVHRAILYDEGQGVAEKFRPYGLPSNEYLARLKQRLRGR